ncbi:MAG: malto-oligosyltrehalose synthase [Chloroflexi bacterium]|nr:malto-oligosyltrehalose synthase [Chloroflexota bacterium]
MKAPPPPAATYRLQFHAGFTFEDARRLIPYLHDLGISHIYASPYLRARSGSLHGYDVADPSSLNPELGSEADFERLVDELGRHAMGQLVDVVPNHMGIGDPGNYRWLDVLENGPASIYAPYFDINWRPTLAQPQDQLKLVVPTLGDQYGKVLENGELSVSYAAGAFDIAYYERQFPVAPDTYPMLIEGVLGQLEAEFGPRDEQVQELASILTAIRHLPPRRMLDAAATEERNREKEIVKRRIARVYDTCAAFQTALARELKTINGTRGDPSSFDRLDALLDRQSYRLAFWRVAAEEINYRRFFDINELAAVRMEDPAVFRDTHRLLMRLIAEGKIQGLRIDHPDGLRDPAAYFRKLQESCLAALDDADRERFYVVVEKILEANEPLRDDWAVSGTTGYDFLNVLNGLFVARNNEQFFSTIYFRFLRQGASHFRDLANSTKKMVMLISLASEVNELGYLLRDIASSDRRHRDFTLNSLTFVIREVIGALGVYRTYIDPDTGRASPHDEQAIDQAVAEAKRRNPRTDPSIFDFVGDTLLLRDEANNGSRQDRLRFIARFQQTTGPVMAKGTEDTAFYQFNRLISLNEVGGDPDTFGRSLTAFHRHNAQRARDWPGTLLASSTHDTKRSEDVRARINVLSELPRDWRAALTRWTRLNGRKKLSIQGRVAPDRNEEYLLYQTLLGAWPNSAAGIDDEFARRVGEFMLKALKEAKVHTSWIMPNTEYEEAVLHFTRVILDARESGAFLDDLAQLQKKVAWFGVFNSLSQTVLKLGSPGVADVYQGNELWDFSLVDPDNRRPVDFAMRQKLLASLMQCTDDRSGLARDLLHSSQDGRIKLYVSQRLLCLRRERPGLFVGGGYTPLRGNPHVAAFARAADGQALVIAAPVQIATLLRGALAPPIGADVWREELLPVPGEAGRGYENLFTGQRLTAVERHSGVTLKLADVFSDFPVAALLAE